MQVASGCRCIINNSPRHDRETSQGIITRKKSWGTSSIGTEIAFGTASDALNNRAGSVQYLVKEQGKCHAKSWGIKGCERGWIFKGSTERIGSASRTEDTSWGDRAVSARSVVYNYWLQSITASTQQGRVEALALGVGISQAGGQHASEVHPGSR